MKWRINSITLQNFKYIHNAYTLPLNGKNLLVYGENGSGKSSFYWALYTLFQSLHIITAKPKAHAFKNEMCFPLTKTKCELKKHPNSKFECFFNDFNRTKTSLFLPFPSKLIQDNLVCVLELQE